jgi:hypothetical protein
MKNAYEFQSVEAGFAMETGIDLKSTHGFTKAMGGKCIELTRTSVCAIAVDKFLTLDRPLHIHHPPLNSSA